MSRPTQDTTKYKKYVVYGIITLYDQDFQLVPLYSLSLYCSPITPNQPKLTWFGLFPLRSPLLRKSLLFSSPAPT